MSYYKAIDLGETCYHAPGKSIGPKIEGHIKIGTIPSSDAPTLRALVPQLNRILWKAHVALKELR